MGIITSREITCDCCGRVPGWGYTDDQIAEKNRATTALGIFFDTSHDKKLQGWLSLYSEMLSETGLGMDSISPFPTVLCPQCLAEHFPLKHQEAKP